jgi:hypothetical protein
MVIGARPHICEVLKFVCLNSSKWFVLSDLYIQPRVRKWRLALSITTGHLIKICIVLEETNFDTWLQLTQTLFQPCVWPTVKHYIAINVTVVPCERRAIPENIQDICKVTLPLPRDCAIFLVISNLSHFLKYVNGRKYNEIKEF